MEPQPEVVVLQPRTFEDVLNSFLQVGRACDAELQAKQVVSFMRRKVQLIQDQLPAVSEWPSVFSLEGINPLVVGGHWIPDMLNLAGGRQDLFEPGCSATRLDWRVVQEVNPDKLFIDLCSSDLARNLREVPWLESQDGWRDLTSVKNGEVYLIDHSYFSRPGPRIIDGLEILAGLTHPKLLSHLAQKQQELGIYFAKKLEDRTGGVEYRFTETEDRVPVLEGSMVFFGCEVLGTHEYGDHIIYVGAVKEMRREESGAPLMFFNSRWYNPAGE